MTLKLSEAIYTGSVWHKRRHIKAHSFRYPIFYLLIDLDDLTNGRKTCRFLSLDKPNLFSIWQRDYGNNSERGLKEQLLHESQYLLLDSAIEKIYMLSLPRILGYSFNPFTTYFCLDATGHLVAVFYEVHNTFGESVTYGCKVDYDCKTHKLSPHSASKELHVSPFFKVEGDYIFHQKLCPDVLTLGIQYKMEKQNYLTAHMRLNRENLTGKKLIKTFLRIPFVTLKIIVAIHFEAALLWLKGIPYSKKPDAPKRRYSFARNN